jgi:hypothetical protein
MVAKFRCLGCVDIDKASIADFSRLAGVPSTLLDLFSREQYSAFHGHEPPFGGEKRHRRIFAGLLAMNVLISSFYPPLARASPDYFQSHAARPEDIRL